MDFDNYKRLGEPEKLEKSEIWQTAIGLQKVDGLEPSRYLIEKAKQNIDGDITFEEVKEQLQTYYEAKERREETNDRAEEADKVSARIAEILSENSFVFSPAELVSIHGRLFNGLYDFAGKIRDYNISKAEWVLNGETVIYAGAQSIKDTLNYDFSREKFNSYKGLTPAQKTERLARFVSGIWQIHPFGEGNTRATAVFAIKYLRSLGFNVNNLLFAENSWYFRNALVRANYNDYKNDVCADETYLIKFFGNLLLNETNVLNNREMRV